MLKPYYTIGDCGFSGRWKSDFDCGWLYRIQQSYTDRVLTEEPPNPHRIDFGGTTWGYRGHNYWCLDETILGVILRWLVTLC